MGNLAINYKNKYMVTCLCRPIGVLIQERYVNLKKPNLMKNDILKPKSLISSTGQNPQNPDTENPTMNTAESQHSYKPVQRTIHRPFNPPGYLGERLKTSKIDLNISNLEIGNSKNKAVIFIGTITSKQSVGESKYDIIECNNIKHRYFIDFDKFLSNNEIFKEILKDYMEITVILHIEAVKPENRPYHCYGIIKEITAKGLLECVFALNKKAKYTILASSCFGFYFHEYAKMLPLDSALITFSDHVSNTLNLEVFFSYFSNAENPDDINSFLLYYMSQSLSFVPCIFISYMEKFKYKYSPQLRITSIFHYISTKYEANIFYSVRNVEQLNEVMDKYCDINDTYNKVTFYVLEKPRDHNMTAYIKNKLCKLPIYNPVLYKDPYVMVNEINDRINDLMHKKEPMSLYFSKIYTNRKSYCHFASACNYVYTEEIKEILKKAIKLGEKFYLISYEINNHK